MRSTASGCWENYCMADDHMHIKNLFLNNRKWEIFFEMFAGWMRILDAWLSDNQQFTIFITLTK
jgi:hypothetical protein